MRWIAGAAVALALAGCSGGSGGGAIRSEEDQRFLVEVSYNETLAGEDPSTLIDLGHEACELLRDYHGNTRRVDAFFVKTAGEGGSRYFSPPVMTALRDAATAVYCP